MTILTTILHDRHMENKKMNAEVLKERIEVMKQSGMPILVRMAKITERLMKMGEKSNE